MSQLSIDGGDLTVGILNLGVTGVAAGLLTSRINANAAKIKELENVSVGIINQLAPSDDIRKMINDIQNKNIPGLQQILSKIEKRVAALEESNAILSVTVQKQNKAIGEIQRLLKEEGKVIERNLASSKKSKKKKKKKKEESSSESESEYELPIRSSSKKREVKQEKEADSEEDVRSIMQRLAGN